jgi:3-phenylpropionate/trans-cinnamate dioxygenase ferredoxin subunit
MLTVGEVSPVRVDDERLLVGRLNDGALYAVADRCSHDGASFDGGTVDGKVLVCPHHGAKFDLLSGKALAMPAVAPIETFPVRVTEDGWVEVDMEDDE